MLQKQLNNLVFVVPFSKCNQSRASFVLVININTLFQQEFNSLITTLFNCVVNRCLSILVNSVEVRPCVDKLLSNLDVALSDAIKNRILPVSVDVIYVCPVI